MNIYVGNIPHSANEDQLKELFAAYGEVATAKIIMDKLTGNSRGFGFVEMATKEDGEKAIAELNGKDFLGRSLRVNEARPREDRPRTRPQNGGSRFGGPRF